PRASTFLPTTPLFRSAVGNDLAAFGRRRARVPPLRTAGTGPATTTGRAPPRFHVDRANRCWSGVRRPRRSGPAGPIRGTRTRSRSEEHTSELQSRENL